MVLVLVFGIGALLALRGNGDQGAAAQATTEPATTADAEPVGDLSPLGQLRGLLSGDEAGPNRDALVLALDRTQQALDAGDQDRATAQLAAVQRTLLGDARVGTVSAAVLRRALSGVDAVADTNGLALPLSVSED